MTHRFDQPTVLQGPGLRARGGSAQRDACTDCAQLGRAARDGRCTQEREPRADEAEPPGTFRPSITSPMLNICLCRKLVGPPYTGGNGHH